ncbi:hypothetical protein [Paracoccus actinidiae]|nr:hypothetical protein [Paracoccus sp. M09]
MLNTDAQITDLDLNAYVDGQLTEQRATTKTAENASSSTANPLFPHK